MIVINNNHNNSGNNVNTNVSYSRCFSTQGSIALVITNVLHIKVTSNLLNKLYNIMKLSRLHFVTITFTYGRPTSYLSFHLMYIICCYRSISIIHVLSNSLINCRRTHFLKQNVYNLSACFRLRF